MGDNKESIELGDFKKEIMDKYLQEVKKELIEKDKQIEKNIWNDFKEEYAILFAKLKYLLLTLHESEQYKLIDMMIELDNTASKLKGEEEPKKGKKDTKEEEEEKSNSELTKEFLQKIEDLGKKLQEIKPETTNEEEGEKTDFQTGTSEGLKTERERIKNKMAVIKKLKIGSNIKIKEKEGDEEEVMLFFKTDEKYIVKGGDNKLKEVIIKDTKITIADDKGKVAEEDLGIIKDWVKPILEEKRKKEKKEEQEEPKQKLIELINRAKNLLDDEDIDNYDEAITKVKNKIKANGNDAAKNSPLNDLEEQLEAWKQGPGKDVSFATENIPLSPEHNKQKEEVESLALNPVPTTTKEIEDAIKERDEMIKKANEGRKDEEIKKINFGEFLEKGIGKDQYERLSKEIKQEINKIGRNDKSGIAETTIGGYNTRIDEINEEIKKLGDENTSDVLKKVSNLLNTYSPEPPAGKIEPEKQTKTEDE